MPWLWSSGQRTLLLLQRFEFKFLENTKIYLESLGSKSNVNFRLKCLKRPKLRKGRSNNDAILLGGVVHLVPEAEAHPPRSKTQFPVQSRGRQGRNPRELI